MSQKTSLHIVLILTFIGSGLNCLSYLCMGAFLPMVRQMFDAGALAAMPEQYLVAYESLIAAPRAFYLMAGIFYGLSLYGAIRMWSLNRTGFHAYTLAQLVLLAVPVLFLGKAHFSIGDAMMTLLFVAFYYFNLRALGVFNPDASVQQADDESDTPSDPTE